VVPEVLVQLIQLPDHRSHIQSAALVATVLVLHREQLVRRIQEMQAVAVAHPSAQVVQVVPVISL
jgi:hypothetical protein